MKMARTGSLALLTTIALAACNDSAGPTEEDLALNEAVAEVGPAANVVVGLAGNRLRVSPAVFNRETDIDVLAEVLS